MTRFNIRVAKLFAPVLFLIGVVSGRAHVVLEQDHLLVNYGLFRYRVPLAEVVAVERMSWPLLYGIGLRIAPGLMLGCVASNHDVVKLTFARKLKLGRLLRYSAMAVSLQEPDAFIAAIEQRTASKVA